jgi:hypothetical protein
MLLGYCVPASLGYLRADPWPPSMTAFRMAHSTIDLRERSILIVSPTVAHKFCERNVHECIFPIRDSLTLVSNVSLCLVLVNQNWKTPN